MTRLSMRLMVAATLLLLPSFVKAQTDIAGPISEPHYFDLNQFIEDLDWESADVQSRIDTRRAGASAPDDIRWIDRIYNLPDYMRTFYDNHGLRVQEVLNGRSNYLSNPSKDIKNALHFRDGSTWVVLKEITRKILYTFPQDVIDENPNALQQYAVAAIESDISEHNDEYLNDVIDFTPYMFMSMSYDYPQAFWLRNYWSWATTWGCTFGYLDESGRDSAEYTFRVLFAIQNSDFDYRVEDFRDPDTLSAAITEYKGLIENILADVPTTTRYDQIRYMNNWLTRHNAYNSCYDSQNSPSIVWSPMSALRGTSGERGPVCEAYARAFKVLCNKLNIPCMLAVGDAIGSRGDTPESHMWNEVKMNDDLWYAVDVTWNDPMAGNPLNVISGYENENWLLLGMYDIVNPSDGLTFAESHPNSMIYGQTQSVKWDFDNYSLITGYKFDPVTGIALPRAAKSADDIYFLGGKFYIINGQKVWIK